jgi:CheY-like chemotaxis protein
VAANVEAPKQEFQPELEGSEKILLVEDEETVRHLTHSILTRSGYQVVSAANGEQALQLAADELEGVHILITDVVMPGMNGRLLAGTLRKRCPELKVLFLSGYAADVTGVEVDSEQEGEFLQKPFSRIELLEKLRRVLDS